MIELECRRALRLEGQQGATLRVVEGRVWITVSNRAEDLVLSAGQSYRIEHEGRVVLESWPTRDVKSGGATIELIPASNTEPAAGPQRQATAAKTRSPAPV